MLVSGFLAVIKVFRRQAHLLIIPLALNNDKQIETGLGSSLKTLFTRWNLPATVWLN